MPPQTKISLEQMQINAQRQRAFIYLLSTNYPFRPIATVKCQNLCYLNLSFYFNHLCHFLCSLPSTCCYCLATPLPSFSAAVISLHSSCTPLLPSTSPTKLFTPHHFYQHTLHLLCLSTFPTTAFCKCSCKIVVSLDVFLSLPSNHTNQIAASITQNCRLFRSNIITSTFTQKRHSAPHFDSTSAHHPLHHFIDFRPTISYFNFNYFMLLMFNNVLMF